MRPALPCLRYAPKHAAPREPLSLETRSVLAAGLAVAVLPLGAAPALADGEPATGTVTTTSAATTSAASTPPAPAAQPAVAPAAQPAVAPAATSAEASPSSTPATAAPRAATASPYAVGPVASPSASPASSSAAPAAAEQKRSSTSLAFSAPRSSRATTVPVGIRLLADGRAVKDGFVRLEKSTPQGWTYVGRLLTNGDGVGRGTLKVAGSAKLRAAYTGSQVRTPAVSAARTVAAVATLGDAVVEEAAKHVGKPYVFGATGPDAFDCSGYTRYVYAKATGRSLPHNARAQERVATPVSKADAQPGDLVFMQDVSGHVGIYAGDGRMYDAPRSGKNVSLRPIWSQNFTVGRIA